MKWSLILIAFLLTSLALLHTSEAAIYRITNNGETIIGIYDSKGLEPLTLKPHTSVITDKLPEPMAGINAEEIDINNATLTETERTKVMDYLKAQTEAEAQKKLDDAKALEANVKALSEQKALADKATAEALEKQNSERKKNSYRVVILLLIIGGYLYLKRKKKCEKCGASNDLDAIICESCGKKLNEVKK